MVHNATENSPIKKYAKKDTKIEKEIEIQENKVE